MSDDEETTGDHWGELNSADIARALFTASDGRIRKLFSRNYLLENTVWGKACKILFPNESPDVRDRFFYCAFG